MTKEESIKKTDQIIQDLENLITDIKSFRESCIDFDDNLIGGRTDEDVDILGAEPVFKDKLNILFYKKYSIFTKNVKKIII